MAHINSIGAGVFSDLSVYNGTTVDFTTTDTSAEFAALFGTANDTPGAATFTRIKNVREFPAMGVPPNIVNVPTYGQKSSQQVQGQSDAPNMEITLNYVPNDWASTSVLGGMVGDGKLHVFRFALLNSEPTATDATQYASTVGGLGSVQNTVYYWIGKIEAVQVNPQLTDANTATVTISIQSKFYGAFTH